MLEKSPDFKLSILNIIKYLINIKFKLYNNNPDYNIYEKFEKFIIFLFGIKIWMSKIIIHFLEIKVYKIS